MKNLVKAGVLLLFITLISGFVAYHSGVFSTEEVKPHLIQVPDQGITYQPTVDSATTEDPTTTTNTTRVFKTVKVDPMLYSSKSLVMKEDWNEHKSALTKFLQHKKSEEKRDSMQRAKQWETVSPR